VEFVKRSHDLREVARMLAARAVHAAQGLLAHDAAPHEVARGGRKAHRLELDEAEPEGEDELPAS